MQFVPAVVGFWIGILFLLALDHLIPHLHVGSDQAEGPRSKLGRTTMMVLAVTLHNIPEGMAVGVMYAGFLAENAQITATSALALSLGNKSERTKQFSEILRHAHIPYQKVTDMHLWQLCHLAMVVPIADAYYESDDPEKVEKEWKIMRKTAERLKRNFNFLRKQKGKLSPWKMNIFCFLPLSFLTIMLAVTFGSSFGDKFMYQHAMKAPDEMRELHKQFYAYMKRMKKCGCKTKKVL